LEAFAAEMGVVDLDPACQVVCVNPRRRSSSMLEMPYLVWVNSRWTNAWRLPPTHAA
jgi:hypothetical protein